jgi:hypothetical protein
MGGLTALMLADRDPTAVASLVNIEGNVAPEDCFLSRQIVSHPHDDPQEFLADFTDRVSGSRYYSSSLFAASLPYKARAAAVKPIFESMVELSDRGGLLERFLALPLPKMFMYGQQIRSLSYLRRLAEDVDGASWGCRAASPSWWCGALAGAVRGRPHMGGVELVARRGRGGRRAVGHPEHEWPGHPSPGRCPAPVRSVGSALDV